MIKFEEHDGKLFRMLEKPVPLKENDVNVLVRFRMPFSERFGGKHEEVAFFCDAIKKNPLYGNRLYAYETRRVGCIAEPRELEIIGAFIEKGSAEWALYQMMQGKRVTKQHWQDSDNIYWCFCDRLRCVQEFNCGTLQIMVIIEIWIKTAEKDSWRIYKEPREEPKLPKEQKIDSGEKEYTCLVCGKKMSKLDGRAEVSIKRISISNLYESTLSHYCGSCFLKLGFDATEKELRSRQQPNPEPTFKVGDWVKYDIDSYLQVIEPSDKERTLCRTLSGLGVIVYPCTSFLTKASPSEVVIHIGCLSGTVEPVSTNGIHVWFHLIGVDDKTIATIRISCLDAPTRELVDGLLKAQEKGE